MMNILYKIFGHTDETETPKGFSEFFTKTDSAKKKKIIKQVVRKANEDQKELIERYNKEFSRV
jgi:hypothetical protein